jgi:L-ribulose-5-phosphate 3-epimerase
MKEKPLRISRRKFLATTSGVVAASATWGHASPVDTGNIGQSRKQVPLKIGHRAANMNMIGNFEVFKVARQIPGLMGVELQVTAGKPNLLDLDAVREYKRQANRWGMMAPSVAGVWSRGSSIMSPRAESDLMHAIRASELLGASVMLLAVFGKAVPDMQQESSYGPVVELLQKVAPSAADAGLTLGLETALSPADNLKLIDLANRPNVKVYYDIYNMAHYGHGAEAIPGIALLGKKRICQVHVKNDRQLIAEPGAIDWAKAFAALNAIAYDGWFFFEDQPQAYIRQRSQLQMTKDTERNVKFIQQHSRMPDE